MLTAEERIVANLETNIVELKVQLAKVADPARRAELRRDLKELEAALEHHAAKVPASSDDLRKRFSDERERAERAAGAELGRRVGERLVAAAAALRKRAAAAAARGTGAAGIVRAYEERDRISELAKATPGYVSGARIADSTQRPEFLAALGAVQPTPFEAHAAVDRAVERPAAGPTPEEVAASASDPIWRQRLVERSAHGAFKQALRTPRRLTV